MLVCWLKAERDLDILQNENWYRIPVDKFNEDLEKYNYFAFYKSGAFKDDERLHITHYGERGNISKVQREELFPYEKNNAEKWYYKIYIHNLKKREPPLYSKRNRRKIFISTTLKKFREATELNDLFNNSVLEDKLWGELKKKKLDFERQVKVRRSGKSIFLDFATLCRNGMVNVECDGSQHLEKENVKKDKRRDNYLVRKGWKVLRYDYEDLNDIKECVSEIAETIYNCGGYATEEKIRDFYKKEY